jgi:TonB family protein
MPTLRPSQGRRVPLAPRRRVVLARNRLGRAAAFSAAVHIALIVAMIITFPNKAPQEAAAPPAVEVVFQPGTKTAKAPATKKGPPQKAQQAAPRGPRTPSPSRVAEATPSAAPAPQLPPPPPPLPVPPPPTPPPSRPIPVPRPVTPPVPRHEAPPERVPPHPPLAAVTPPPKPAPPKPVSPKVPTPKLQPAKPPTPAAVTLKPPAPPLPQINLPPPPPIAPAAPTLSVPLPAPPPPAPPANAAEAEMNLELPPMPELAPLPLPLPPPPLPPLPPAPQPQRLARRRAPARSSALGGSVVMNGMSFSGGGSASGGFTRGMNLTLPEAQQPGSSSDLSVQGDVGSNWIAELEEWVNERKYYPEMAGEMNQQGTVVIRFSVDRAGHVSHLEMVSPTGYALLDQAWLGLFRGADLPPRPHDGTSDIATVTAAMHFEIIR